MSSQPSKPTHLDPSALGTKEYWDHLYSTEITNHSLDPSDEGTIWFDDSSAEDKVIQFLEEKLGETLLGGSEGEKPNWKSEASFLDLGTGNGHFLFRLREGEEDDEDYDDEDEGETGVGQGEMKNGGWKGRMLGVDYSQRSIEFARRIADDKRVGQNSSGDKVVEFLWWDIMNEDPKPMVLSGKEEKGWDVVLDKGTFDAISLSEEKDQSGRRICEGYRERVLPLIREGGLLVLTSCNWTEEELKGWFLAEACGGATEGLVFVEALEYRSFSFGGKKGQTISSVCFRKENIQ